MSWLTQGSEMVLQDVIMANARLHNVLENSPKKARALIG